MTLLNNLFNQFGGADDDTENQQQSIMQNKLSQYRANGDRIEKSITDIDILLSKEQQYQTIIDKFDKFEKMIYNDQFDENDANLHKHLTYYINKLKSWYNELPGSKVRNTPTANKNFKKFGKHDADDQKTISHHLKYIKFEGTKPKFIILKTMGLEDMNNEHDLSSDIKGDIMYFHVNMSLDDAISELIWKYVLPIELPIHRIHNEKGEYKFQFKIDDNVIAEVVDGQYYIADDILSPTLISFNKIYDMYVNYLNASMGKELNIESIDKNTLDKNVFLDVMKVNANAGIYPSSKQDEDDILNNAILPVAINVKLYNYAKKYIENRRFIQSNNVEKYIIEKYEDNDLRADKYQIDIYKNNVISLTLNDLKELHKTHKISNKSEVEFMLIQATMYGIYPKGISFGIDNDRYYFELDDIQKSSRLIYKHQYAITQFLENYGVIEIYNGTVLLEKEVDDINWLKFTSSEDNRYSINITESFISDIMRFEKTSDNKYRKYIEVQNFMVTSKDQLNKKNNIDEHFDSVLAYMYNIYKNNNDNIVLRAIKSGLDFYLKQYMTTYVIDNDIVRQNRELVLLAGDDSLVTKIKEGIQRKSANEIFYTFINTGGIPKQIGENMTSAGKLPLGIRLDRDDSGYFFAVYDKRVYIRLFIKRNTKGISDAPENDNTPEGRNAVRLALTKAIDIILTKGVPILFNNKQLYTMKSLDSIMSRDNILDIIIENSNHGIYPVLSTDTSTVPVIGPIYKREVANRLENNTMAMFDNRYSIVNLHNKERYPNQMITSYDNIEGFYSIGVGKKEFKINKMKQLYVDNKFYGSDGSVKTLIDIRFSSKNMALFSALNHYFNNSNDSKDTIYDSDDIKIHITTEQFNRYINMKPMSRDEIKKVLLKDRRAKIYMNMSNIYRKPTKPKDLVIYAENKLPESAMMDAIIEKLSGYSSNFRYEYNKIMDKISDKRVKIKELAVMIDNILLHMNKDGEWRDLHKKGEEKQLSKDLYNYYYVLLISKKTMNVINKNPNLYGIIQLQLPNKNVKKSLLERVRQSKPNFLDKKIKMEDNVKMLKEFTDEAAISIMNDNVYIESERIRLKKRYNDLKAEKESLLQDIRNLYTNIDTETGEEKGLRKLGNYIDAHLYYEILEDKITGYNYNNIKNTILLLENSEIIDNIDNNNTDELRNLELRRNGIKALKIEYNYNDNKFEDIIDSKVVPQILYKASIHPEDVNTIEFICTEFMNGMKKMKDAKVKVQLIIEFLFKYFEIGKDSNEAKERFNDILDTYEKIKSDEMVKYIKNSVQNMMGNEYTHLILRKYIIYILENNVDTIIKQINPFDLDDPASMYYIDDNEVKLTRNVEIDTLIDNLVIEHAKKKIFPQNVIPVYKENYRSELNEDLKNMGYNKKTYLQTPDIAKIDWGNYITKFKVQKNQIPVIIYDTIEEAQAYTNDYSYMEYRNGKVYIYDDKPNVDEVKFNDTWEHQLLSIMSKNDMMLNINHKIMSNYMDKVFFKYIRKYKNKDVVVHIKLPTPVTIISGDHNGKIAIAVSHIGDNLYGVILNTEESKGSVLQLQEDIDFKFSNYSNQNTKIVDDGYENDQVYQHHVGFDDEHNVISTVSEYHTKTENITSLKVNRVSANSNEFYLKEYCLKILQESELIPTIFNPASNPDSDDYSEYINILKYVTNIELQLTLGENTLLVQEYKKISGSTTLLDKKDIYRKFVSGLYAFSCMIIGLLKGDSIFTKKYLNEMDGDLIQERIRELTNVQNISKYIQQITEINEDDLPSGNIVYFFKQAYMRVLYYTKHGQNYIAMINENDAKLLAKRISRDVDDIRYDHWTNLSDDVYNIITDIYIKLKSRFTIKYKKDQLQHLIPNMYHINKTDRGLLMRAFKKQHVNNNKGNIDSSTLEFKIKSSKNKADRIKLIKQLISESDNVNTKIKLYSTLKYYDIENVSEYNNKLYELIKTNEHKYYAFEGQLDAYLYNGDTVRANSVIDYVVSGQITFNYIDYDAEAMDIIYDPKKRGNIREYSIMQDLIKQYKKSKNVNTFNKFIDYLNDNNIVRDITEIEKNVYYILWNNGSPITHDYTGIFNITDDYKLVEWMRDQLVDWYLNNSIDYNLITDVKTYLGAEAREMSDDTIKRIIIDLTYYNFDTLESKMKELIENNEALLFGSDDNSDKIFNDMWEGNNDLLSGLLSQSELQLVKPVTKILDLRDYNISKLKKYLIYETRYDSQLKLMKLDISKYHKYGHPFKSGQHIEVVDHPELLLNGKWNIYMVKGNYIYIRGIKTSTVYSGGFIRLIPETDDEFDIEVEGHSIDKNELIYNTQTKLIQIITDKIETIKIGSIIKIDRIDWINADDKLANKPLECTVTMILLSDNRMTITAEPNEVVKQLVKGQVNYELIVLEDRLTIDSIDIINDQTHLYFKESSKNNIISDITVGQNIFIGNLTNTYRVDGVSGNEIILNIEDNEIESGMDVRLSIMPGTKKTTAIHKQLDEKVTYDVTLNMLGVNYNTMSSGFMSKYRSKVEDDQIYMSSYEMFKDYIIDRFEHMRANLGEKGRNEISSRDLANVIADNSRKLNVKCDPTNINVNYKINEEQLDPFTFLVKLYSAESKDSLDVEYYQNTKARKILLSRHNVQELYRMISEEWVLLLKRIYTSKILGGDPSEVSLDQTKFISDNMIKNSMEDIGHRNFFNAKKLFGALNPDIFSLLHVKLGVESKDMSKTEGNLRSHKRMLDESRYNNLKLMTDARKFVLLEELYIMTEEWGEIIPTLFFKNLIRLLDIDYSFIYNDDTDIVPSSYCTKQEISSYSIGELNMGEDEESMS